MEDLKKDILEQQKYGCNEVDGIKQIIITGEDCIDEFLMKLGFDKEPRQDFIKKISQECQRLASKENPIKTASTSNNNNDSTEEQPPLCKRC